MQRYTPPLSRTLRIATLLLFTAALLVPALAFAQGGQIDQQFTQSMIVMHPDAMGHIDSLSTLHAPYLQEKDIDQRELNQHPVLAPNPKPGNVNGQDGAMQLSQGPLISGSSSLSFDGLGDAITGPNGTFTVNSVPPDTNMAVGTTQIVHTVNSGFAVYDKTTGAMTFGPYNITALWQVLPVNSPCTGSIGVANTNVSMSDPVVSYDQFAQRWLITIIAIPYSTSTGANLPPFYHCVAYSTGADAGGGWSVFEYNPGSGLSGWSNSLPDYPKQGIWRDAYTFTYDEFNAAGTTYQGVAICGMDRNALINGTSVSIICFKSPLTSSDYALMPATIDGSLYPPLQTSGTAGTDSCSAGSPCQPKALFMEVSGSTGAQTTAYLYRAHFNFTTPANSAVDSRVTITVTSYNNTPCSTSSKCAVQPTHTGSLPSGETFASESALDTLVAHAMWRGAYRNFGSYESLVFDHTVRGTTTQTAETRWYEFRGFNSSTGTGTPTVQQQSTFNPDTNATFRIQGSIAADHNNNMLMGYTGTSASVFPSLYITGRLAGDTASTMQAEQKIFAGLNSQVNVTINGNSYPYGYRWGDYSSTVIDPDDCTFWYTTEYMKQAGLFNWSTRMVNWNFGSANCSSLASITSPIPNAQGGKALTSATATFLWTSGTGTPTYTLAVGSTQGGSNYCSGPQSYGAGVYTATLSCLPTDGSTFWVRLTSIATPGGFQDYQYTAPSLAQSTTTTVGSSQNPSAYGQAVNFTATVTAGSGTPTGTVQFKIDGTSFGSPVTLVSGSATSGSTSTLSVATHTVTADYAPTGSFLASSGTLSGGQVVDKATLTVTADNQSKVYGDPLPTLTYTMTGFVGTDNQGNSTTGQPSITTTATESSPVGPYTITSALGTLAATNYTFVFVDGTLTIGQRNASVTPDPATKVYGQSDPTLTGTLVGFLPSDNVVATYSRTPGETVLGSPYIISATLDIPSRPSRRHLSSDPLGNYNITYNTANFTITPAPASVTPDAASKIYGTSDPTFTGTLVGFLPADNVTATYTRTAGETVGGSPYVISATLNTSSRLGKRPLFSDPLSNYTITYNTANFTINPAPASVTPDAASKIYGTSDPTLTGTLVGFLPSDNVTATYSRTAGETVAGSPYLISATLNTNGPRGRRSQGGGVLDNYIITYNTANFTIDPAPASVTPDAASKIYGTSDPTLTGTLVGFLPADNVTATYSRTAGETVGGSPYLISATLNTSSRLGKRPLASDPLSNYTITYNTANFTINPAPASVTPNPAGKVYGQTDPAFTGTLVGFLPSDNVTATYTRNSGEGAGPYTISATLNTSSRLGKRPLASDPLSNYTITYNTATFTISQAVLTVTANDATIPDGSPLPTFTASYTGFQFGDGVGVLSGSPSLTTTAPQNPPAGTYPINASQGTLSAANYTFTFVSGTLTVTPVTGQITSPAKGSTLTGSSATFTWSHESGASSYQLWLGHTAGTHDIGATTTANLFATLNNLPTDGSTIYATLYGYASGHWTVQDTATYTAASNAKAVITSPTKGSTLTGSSVTFGWSAETGATSYQLWVGHSAGTHDLAIVTTSSLSALVNNLPTDGSQVYVSLYGHVGTIWSLQDTASYTAVTNLKAVITSPPKGSTLTSSSVTFGWTSEAGATSYQLWVGHSAGTHDIAVITTGNLSATVNNLPTDGSQLYVTLYGYAGTWTLQDTASYTAAGITKAAITSPLNGSTLSGSTVTFTWTAETGATSYQLWVGHTPGGHDITVRSTSGLSTTVVGLPTDGSLIYVTLYGNGGGGWSVQDTASYTTGP